MASVDTHGPALADPEYALSSSSADEHARLSRQSELYEPFTRRLLLRAGLESEMGVLDVGCGPGDVSFLVSGLVGAEGAVVGIDRDEQAVASARQRAAESGIGNVEFVPGELHRHGSPPKHDHLLLKDAGADGEPRPAGAAAGRPVANQLETLPVRLGPISR